MIIGMTMMACACARTAVRAAVRWWCDQCVHDCRNAIGIHDHTHTYTLWHGHIGVVVVAVVATIVAQR